MNAYTIAQAGGVAPLGESDPRMDEVSTRHYRHPALGDRVVIRLVPQTLRQADDLSMEFHGFLPPETATTVGRQLRKGLGFPAWALVHDPARGSLALAVVKEFRAQARIARSRPGAAKEGFCEIAARLAASVPHFLPSFFEEAGRVFLESGNAGMAIQMFGKAREAEKVHALSVDETLRRESFLEFALAGAISVKALTAYAQDLARERSAEEAYGQYRELCLRRTLGGMPPWAAMLKDLNKLAKAAGLDAVAEEMAFVAEILGSASLARAPIEFWSTARASVKELCRQSPARAIAVLKLKPSFSGNRLKHGQSWLELLEGWGLTRLLTDLDNQALAPGEAADWLSGVQSAFADYNSPPNPEALFGLVRRMAPRLQEEGRAVTLKTGWRQLDLDLAELMLELEIPVKVESSLGYPIDFPSWAGYSGAERRRDPVLAGQHAQLRAILLNSLDRHTGNPAFEAAAAGRPGWAQLRRLWLTAQVDELEQGALPALKSLLDRWEGYQLPQMLVAYPELCRRVRGLPVANLLARTLRGFLTEELRWPALEQAVTELSPDGKTELGFDGYFPNLVVTTKTRAIAVGRDGILARHDIRLPQGARLQSVYFIGGQFLTSYYHNYQEHSAWSGGQPVTMRGYRSNALSSPAAELPGIGLTYGARAVQGGDSEVPSPPGRFYSDGQTCWVHEWADGKERLREVDPRTGKQGRVSLPAFLEDYLLPGSTLVLQACSLYPLPDDKGLQGFRVRQVEDGRVEAESLDGWRYSSSKEIRPHGLLPTGSLPLPGTRRAIFTRHNYLQVVDPESDVVVADSFTFSQAPLFALALHWWSMFDWRNEADSLRLRRLTDQQAARLLEKKERLDLNDPLLQAGATAVVEVARDLGRRLGKFSDELESAEPVETPLPATALKDILATFSIQANQAHDLREEVKALTAMASQLKSTGKTGLLQKLTGFFSKGAAPPSFLEQSAIPPLSVLTTFAGAWASLAWRAAAPFTEPSQTRAAADTLEAWAKSPLLAEPENFRRVALRSVDGHHYPTLALLDGQNGYLAEREGYGDRPFHGVEYHPGGHFKVPSSARIEGSTPLPKAETSQTVTRYAQALRSMGARSWNPEEPRRLSELTGLSLAESCLVCAGLPGISSYEANFLPPAVREQMGLKAAEARVARDNLRQLSRWQRVQLYRLAMPADPETLWTEPEQVAERLAEAWGQVVGKRLAASEERLKELADLGAPFKPAVMLGALGALSESGFAKDGRSTMVDGQLKRPADVFSEEHLHSLVAYLSYLYEYAPAGDALRQASGQAWPLCLERLAHPDLLFTTGYLYSDDEAQKQAWKRLAVDSGFEIEDSRWAMRFLYRPAKHRPDADVFRALQPYLINTAWPAWLMTQTPEFLDLVARLREDLPSGYETDPTVSAPELVPRVESHLGLSTPAAILYLQTLALARPTSKNIQLWNGWTPAIYKKATQELLASGLVLEAKRSRAGRSHFLPGGWEELKAPHLPLESWKLSFYQLPTQPPGFLLGRVLSLRPLGATFELAWQRVLDGDVPAYDESKALGESKKGRKP
jgi:hypothetical protein